MKLRYAFLAEFAKNDGEQKLSVIGGDFDTIGASTFPITMPLLCLTVSLQVQPTECARSHQLRVELIGANGVLHRPPLQLEFQAQPHPVHRHRPISVTVVLNALNLRFDQPGDYAFHVLVDDLELGNVPLYVEQTPVMSLHSG